MGSKNKKTQIKINLLEMSETEKVEVMEKLKQNLQQSIIEAKLWNALLQCETVIVNGRVVFSERDSLNGLLMQKADM